MTSSANVSARSFLKNGEESFYSRAGAFGLDSEGTLVNPANGFRVQGWMADELNGEMVLNTASNPEDLIIPVGSKDPAKATTNVNFARIRLLKEGWVNPRISAAREKLPASAS